MQLAFLLLIFCGAAVADTIHLDRKALEDKLQDVTRLPFEECEKLVPVRTTLSRLGDDSTKIVYTQLRDILHLDLVMMCLKSIYHNNYADKPEPTPEVVQNIKADCGLISQSRSSIESEAKQINSESSAKILAEAKAIRGLFDKIITELIKLDSGRQEIVFVLEKTAAFMYYTDLCQRSLQIYAKAEFKKAEFAQLVIEKVSTVAVQLANAIEQINNEERAANFQHIMIYSYLESYMSSILYFLVLPLVQLTGLWHNLAINYSLSPERLAEINESFAQLNYSQYIVGLQEGMAAVISANNDEERRKFSEELYDKLPVFVTKSSQFAEFFYGILEGFDNINKQTLNSPPFYLVGGYRYLKAERDGMFTKVFKGASSLFSFGL